MKFVHEVPDFNDLVLIVGKRQNLLPALVEKDYWVTQTLWSLEDVGLEVWFKGGTSLSKGFRLIDRFSEDLDLKVEPGKGITLRAVANWKSEGKQAVAARKAYFEELANVIVVPGARVTIDEVASDDKWRNGSLRVTYPGRHLGDLPKDMKPFVLLEIGNARVVPFVERDMTSFVHDELESQNQIGAFKANRPMGLRCVHPVVTLLDKLDALHRHVRRPREEKEASSFVRHFEDAAKIAAAHDAKKLPPLDGFATARALCSEMLRSGEIRQLPDPSDDAFALPLGPRTTEIRTAYAAISPMFWGDRMSLDDACGQVRAWITAEFS